MSEEERIFQRIPVVEGEVNVLLSGLGYEVQKVQELPGGLINSNFRCWTSAGEKLLRVYNPERTEEEVEFELSTLRRLQGVDGLQVQVPEIGLEGGLFHGSRFVVLGFLSGKALDPSELTPSLSYQAGCLIGRMQRSLRGFVPQGKRAPFDAVAIEGLVIDSIAGLVPTEQRHLMRLWDRAVAGYDDSAGPQGVVHADLHPGSTVREGDSISGFIDFDDAYFGNQDSDVCIAAMEFASKDGKTLECELLSAFISGWNSEKDRTIDAGRIIAGMWVNSFRFFGYTLPLTLRAGKPWTENAYAYRILQLAQSDVRETLLGAVEHA